MYVRFSFIKAFASGNGYSFERFRYKIIYVLHLAKAFSNDTQPKSVVNADHMPEGFFHRAYIKVVFRKRVDRDDIAICHIFLVGVEKSPHQKH